MIKKSVSKWLLLATIPILGQPPRDDAVVFYCNGITCMGSSVASQKAVEWGWTNVIYYREGFRHWQAEGRLIEQK